MNELQRQLANYTVSDWRAWLVVGFKNGSFAGLVLSSDASSESQVSNFILTLEDWSRERCKRGLVDAIAEWRPNTVPTTVLEKLALVASYVNVVDCLPSIRKLFEGGWLRTIDDDESRRTEQVLIEVAQGFAPHVEVEIMFTQIFFSDRVRSSYAPNIFLGLCRCRPTELKTFISRFLEIADTSDTPYAWRLIEQRFKQLVSGNAIYDAMNALGSETNKQVVALLYRHQYEWKAVPPEASGRSLPMQLSIAPVGVTPEASAQSTPMNRDVEDVVYTQAATSLSMRSFTANLMAKSKGDA